MTKSNQKITGSYYTCDTVADYICKWAINTGKETLLEPSFGDGQFIESAIKRFRFLKNEDPTVYGVELQTETYNKFIQEKIRIRGYCGDFMDYDAERKVDAVIGNPPYISLKNMKESDRGKAFRRMEKYKIEMPMAGSLWMPFVVHASEQLVQGGRLGFVLPYEVTYVRYSFKLWEYLKNNFGKITIARIHDDFFPDVDVETVVFLAENKGGKTETVHYRIFQTMDDMVADICMQESDIPIADIISMNKPFEAHLVGDPVWRMMERLQKNGMLAPIREECKFKIGYVCGNKKFFHPTAEDIQIYNIAPEDLIPSIVNARQINRERLLGVDAVGLKNSSCLFYPKNAAEREAKYIEHGEECGVDKGYKCSIRSPWYITPCMEIPDVILTVFGNVPRLMKNSGGYAVSNSLLCGILRDKSKGKELICRWYNSLTLLVVEIYIHSLGGGTLVLIPGEVDQLKILSSFPEEKSAEIFRQLDENMKQHGAASTYELGDEIVLKQLYGFTPDEIAEIRSALKVLRSWRCPEERRG